MALFSEKSRKAKFDALGLGEYNKENIKKLQKKYLRPQDVDGVYGVDTDRLLRHLYNVKLCAPDFKPTEFKCECGGRYCTGYPTYMKRVELRHIQAIRDHYDRPMLVTCGLRCKTYNSKLSGSVSNSLHLVGRAVDFYMQGVTDTLANRKRAIRWIKARPHHHYTYGNGINSNGYRIYAPYMGNALHTDVYKATEPKKSTPSTIGQKVLDTCRVQAEWMKNYTYSWPLWKPRNVERSKKYGTCVTYVACVLQRLGYLQPGEYLWNNGKGYGTGKVYIWGPNGKRSIKASDRMVVKYMGNKQFKNLQNELKAGDIVMVDDNKSGESGGGGHIMIFAGKWTKKGNPYIWDNYSADRVKAGAKGAHTYGYGRKVLAIVRLKEATK